MAYKYQSLAQDHGGAWRDEKLNVNLKWIPDVDGAEMHNWSATTYRTSLCRVPGPGPRDCIWCRTCNAGWPTCRCAT
jgi:hypothetical protein